MKMLADGNVKVTYVPTIASLAAPKAATELAAGTAVPLECIITADGLNISVDEAVVALPALCETFDSESPGRAKYSIDLTFYRYTLNTEDVAWNTIKRAVSGYLVVRYGTPATTAYAAADKLLVFPVTFGERRPQATTANGGVTFGSKAYVTAQPNLDAVAAA